MYTLIVLLEDKIVYFFPPLVHNLFILCVLFNELINDYWSQKSDKLFEYIICRLTDNKSYYSWCHYTSYNNAKVRKDLVIKKLED